MNNLFAITLLTLSVSCAHHHSGPSEKPRVYVDVNSITGASAINKAAKVVVVSGMADFKTTDLRFQNYANVVYNVLAESGYQITANSKQANVEVVLNFAIEDASTTSTYTVPVYKQVGVSNIYGQQVGTLSGFENQTMTSEIVRYRRTVVLRAYDKTTGTNLWEVKGVSEGPSHKLKDVFPYMVMAMQQKIGTTTQEEVVVFLDEAKASELRKPASLSK